MKVDGQKTYWGIAISDDLSRKTNRFLGYDCEVRTPGINARITEQREVAVEICDNQELEGYNARQIMLKHTGAHGSGIDFTFPGSEEIEDNMKDHPRDYKVNVYGDGSFTSPTVWWVALGGFGIWVLKWQRPQQPRGSEHSSQQEKPGLGSNSTIGSGTPNCDFDDIDSHQHFKEDTVYFGAALWQTGTSTRQKLTAWLRVLAIPCRILYATNVVSMMNKALRPIKAAEKTITDMYSGNNNKKGSPFGKPWGLQVDGDLWEQAWKAVLNQFLRQVKGHATEKGR